jgi:hypothetical protein
VAVDRTSRAPYWIAGIVVIAVAIAAAVWLHGYKQTSINLPASCRSDSGAGFGARYCNPAAWTTHKHPSWADPMAVGIAIVGVGVGGGLLWKAVRG